MKLAAARAALDYVQSGAVLGVGSGSTVNLFIDELARIKQRVEAAVASSEATAQRLAAVGIRVVDLNQVDYMPIYIDGADEVNEHLSMIKGGGGALTREKIAAAVAREFVCIADESKFVPVLGRFPLPVEVIPMARSYIARELVRLGSRPVLRQGFTTDNGNVILDAHHFEITNPVELETAINQLAGVVTCGLFARRGANVLLLAHASGVRQMGAHS